MSSYAQIYINKKNEKIRKSNNSSSLNQSKETLKASKNFYPPTASNKLPPNNNNKITERNASIVTFSSLKMINNNNIQDKEIKNSEKRFLTEEGKKNEEKSPIKEVNISDKKNHIIELGKNRIKYRNSNFEIKNNSINFDDNFNGNLIKDLEGKEKLKQKLLEKEKRINEKDNKIIKNETLNSSSPNKSKEKNIYKKNNNIMNKSKINNKKINNKNKIDKNKNINKFNYNKNSNMLDNEISIRSEGSNNLIYETKYNKKDIKNREDINLVKELKEKILSKEEILYYTHIIFLNNASFIKNKNQYMMSKLNFLNILKSLNLISSQFILVEIDLIYDSISPKSQMIIYSQFNQILMKIIQKLYPEKYKISPKLTINYFLNKLINQYRLFFENNIPKDFLYKYQYNSIVKLLQIFPNEKQIFIMNELFLTINEIYEKYFSYELNYNHDFIYKSGDNLIKFCRDFEIIPQVINPTQAMTYYNLTIHINQIYNYFINEIKKYRKFQNKGIIFTLIHFMIFFIHISLYSYTKIFGSKTWTYDVNDSIMTNEAKLILFLEKIEHSKGMCNFLQKLSTPRTKSITLLPSKEICSSLGIFDIYNKKIQENIYLGDVFFNEKDNQIEKDEKKEKDKQYEKDKMLEDY